jgi:YebC/PmpR family DNA-binding regulatory protein
LTYEGYGPGGVAVLVETMSDNRNRTVAEVRHAFSKAGGNLGTDGSVAYLFDRKGQILFEPGTSEDDVMEIAIEFGADDVETEDDGSISVSTTADDYMAVKDALFAGGLEPAASEVAMIPQNYSELNVDMGEKVLRLVDALEDLDDVTNVYTNANFPDELMG